MYPSLKTAVLSKRLGDEWREMPGERKAFYTERAKYIREKFNDKHPDYVYTRRSSKKRTFEDDGGGVDKKYKSESAPRFGGAALDPNRPRRPMNAYLIFNKEMRHQLLVQNANMTVTQISQEIGRQWKNMSTERKRQYMDRATRIKGDFLKINPNYVYSRRSKAEIAAANAMRRRGTNIKGGGNNSNSNSGSSQGSNQNSSNSNSSSGNSNSNGGSSSGSGNSGRGSHHGNSSSSHSNGALSQIALPNHSNQMNTNNQSGSNSNNGGGAQSGANGHGNSNANGNSNPDKKVRAKKRAKDPEAPRHPTPPFLFFRSREGPRIRQQNPNEPIPTVAARMWKDMTADQKAPWTRMAEEDKRRYAEEMRVYVERRGLKPGASD
ncbi:Transcription factor SOX-7 [Actinomortierella ambigua]|nr:Transcription factor SOX-7 [Actinomortierella ambigua]